MNILKPRVKPVEQPVVQPYNLNFDEILDLLSKPAPIQIQFNKNQKDLNPAFETIQQSDIQVTIKKYTQLGSQLLIDNNLKEGIEVLRKSESLLNLCFQKEIQVDTDLMLEGLINLGVCYYKIGLLEESLVCFENCLVTLRSGKQESNKKNQEQQILNNQEYQATQTKKLKYRRFKCKLHIQCCIILSEMMRHDEALAHSKYAIHISFKLFLDSIIICYQTLIMQKNPDKQENNNQKQDGQFQSQTVMILSILVNILEKIRSLNFSQEQTKKEFVINVLQKACGPVELVQPDMNHIFDKLTEKSLLLQKSSILQYLQMGYQNSNQISQEIQMSDEITEDSIFYKISNMAACFYCASTESRFIEERNMMYLYSQNIILESEFMLTKAVTLAYTYLKNDIPFVLQILRVYQRFHSANQQIISESEEYDKSFVPQYKIIYLKAAKGIKSLDLFIPIIRLPNITQNLNQNLKPQTGQVVIRQTGKSEKFKITQGKPKKNKEQEKLEKIYMQVGPNIKQMDQINKNPQEKPSSADNIKTENIQKNQKMQEKNANLAQLSKIYKNSVLQPKSKKPVPINNYIDPQQLKQECPPINKKRPVFKQQIQLIKPQNENIIINNNINFLINEHNWESGNKLMQQVMNNIKTDPQKKKNTFFIKKV